LQPSFELWLQMGKNWSAKTLHAVKEQFTVSNRTMCFYNWREGEKVYPDLIKKEFYDISEPGGRVLPVGIAYLPKL